MKPLVYYGIKEIDEDTLSVSKKLFDEILDEVYVAGFADGQKNGSLSNGTLVTYSSITDNKALLNDAASSINSLGGGAICISPHD